MRKTIQLKVNESEVRADVEPRLQLADFLREHLLLTGTHLGCEHGVCGACTVQIDGAPARACIAYAVACDGAEVTTIEGFDHDSVMAELREAFSAEHALQCGYCTPGMLVTARDIVLRLPNADEARIRKELAGNLCRCTGYVGIVRAIQRVIAERHTEGTASERHDSSAAESGDEHAVVELGRSVQHVEAPAVMLRSGAPRGAHELRRPAPDSKRGSDSKQGEQEGSDPKPQTTLHQSFIVDHARDKVWSFFGHLDQVTLCLPGTSLLGAPTDDHVDTKIRIKVGPIVAEFEGAADAVRDPSNYSGMIHGSARDVRSSSATRGEIRYVLLEKNGGAATRVDVDVGFTLTGPLAQFSRSSIVQDIARRMTAAFAQNLQARLNQASSGAGVGGASQIPVAELDAGSLFFSVLWNRIRASFRSLFRR
ncbi:MAG: aerobic carbon-monoxide dehydrogenase small subunit [Betaproteobacteria bacterium]